MMKKIAGEFTVELQPQEDTTEVGRMLLAKEFSGSLSGVCAGQMLSIRGQRPGSAGYVAMEVFNGTLNGLTGSFAMQHTGTMNRGQQSLVINVVPDSGTDNLKGLTGVMHIRIEDGKHYYDFDYRLDPETT